MFDEAPLAENAAPIVQLCYTALETTELKAMILHLENELAAWAGDDAFAAACNQRGEIFREKEGRCTLRFYADGGGYFLKLHRGVGWREIFKNLLQLRLPVIGAQNEWRAIHKLQSLQVPTMAVVGYGKRGRNPATQLSFIVTRELEAVISLEELAARWQRRPPPFALKLAVLKQLAEATRTMHANGINHRDYYLCHLWLYAPNGRDNLRADALRLHVADLHRAQLRRRTPRRWLVKDLAALYFSAMDYGITARDALRFIRFYRDANLREVLTREARFWRRVQRAAMRLVRRGRRG